MSLVGKRWRIDLVEDCQIDFNLLYNHVSSPNCGAIHTFSGTIRDTDVSPSSLEQPGHLVAIKGIRYEAYCAMVLKQLEQIIQHKLTSVGADPNSRLAVGLRLGFVPAGEVSIVICASSTGRRFSHQCTMDLLDEIKSKAVIWKKIVYNDGREQWDSEAKSEATWLSQRDGPK